MTIAKLTADKDTVFQQVIYMYLVTSLLSGLLGLGIGDGRFSTGAHPEIAFITQAWHMDDLLVIARLSAIGVVGTIAFLMLISAYRISDPAAITPFEYTGLLTTMLGGFLVWGEIPGLRVAAGMLLIVGSGIFLFYRENLRGQKMAAETPLR